MAATDGSGDWLVTEDGCLMLNENLNSVSYHSSLNVFLTTAKDSNVKVIDAPSGQVLQELQCAGWDVFLCIFLFLSMRKQLIFCC